MTAIHRPPAKHMLAASLLVAAGLVHAQEVPKGPLPRTVVPDLVQLELKLDPKQAEFSGRTRIQARVAQATDVVWMHGRGLKIGKAEATLADGRKIALRASDADVSGVLRLQAAEQIPAGEATIDIEYDARFGELQGAYRVKPDGNDYIVTQMEPLGARNTFPGFDEPSFKQPWEISLIVPEDDVAVANSAEAKTERLGDGWKKVTFNRTEALPSYLIAFAVGPWDVPAGPDIPASGVRSAPVKLRGIAAKGQGGRMRYSLANTGVIVTALEDYFGTPYPFDKLDNLAAPDFWAGAMENAGLIVYRDSLMFPDENSPVGQRQAFWGVSAHELAHQWFGDLVTMKWWDDLWLNEGFATWMGNKIHGQLQPQAHTDRRLLEGAIEAMGADSLASSRRVHEPIGDFTQIQSAFDGITYQKGGATLNMFEQYIGAGKFRDGIRTYLKTHARGNATSADLIAAVAAQGTDPAAIESAFKSYIDQAGVPFLKIDLECGAGKPALIVHQQRYLPLGSTANASQTWGVPLAVRYRDGDTVREEKAILSGAQSRFELEQAQSCPAWVMPNAHGNGYYRFSLTPALQDKLSGAFAELDEREQRMYADSVTAAYGAGQLTPSQLLQALPQFTTAKVRQTVTAGMDSIGWMEEYLLQDEAQRSAFRAQAAALYRPRLDALGLVPREGEEEDQRLLRNSLINAFAFDFKDQKTREYLKSQGDKVLGLGRDGVQGDGRLHKDAVPQELRGAAIAVAVAEGGAQAFDLAERHFRAEQDPTLRGQLLGAMGRVQDPALAERARGFVFEDGLLRRNEIFGAVGGQVEHEALRPAVREWIDEHFTTLEAKLSPAGAALIHLYSAGMCSSADAAELESKFAARMAKIEGGPLELKQQVEGIRLCEAQLRARHGQPLEFARR